MKVLGRSGAAAGPPPTPPTRRRCSEALEASRDAWWPSAAPTRPRGPVGRSAAEDGAGTGTAVCVPRPGTPVDAAVDLDVVWSPGVPPAGP